MTCQEAMAFLSAYLDGELNTEEEARLRAHLDTCAACSSLLDAYTQIDSGMADLDDVPEGFAQRVIDALPEQTAPKHPRRFAFGGFTALAAVAAVLVLMVATGRLSLPQKAADSAASTELSATQSEAATADSAARELEPESAAAADSAAEAAESAVAADSAAEAAENAAAESVPEAAMFMAPAAGAVSDQTAESAAEAPAEAAAAVEDQSDEAVAEGGSVSFSLTLGAAPAAEAPAEEAPAEEAPAEEAAEPEAEPQTEAAAETDSDSGFTAEAEDLPQADTANDALSEPVPEPFAMTASGAQTGAAEAAAEDASGAAVIEAPAAEAPAETEPVCTVTLYGASPDALPPELEGCTFTAQADGTWVCELDGDVLRSLADTLSTTDYEEFSSMTMEDSQLEGTGRLILDPEG